MSDGLRDYGAADFVDHTDVNHPDADSIHWVSVPGEEDLFLYLWDTETDSPVASVVGFDPEGLEMLEEWVTNVKVEHGQRGDGA